MTAYPAQFTGIKQTLQQHLDRRARQLERIQAQLAFADRLCAAYPDWATAWQPLIIEAGRIVQAGVNANRDLDTVIAQAEAVLAPIGDIAKSYTLLCISHAHIDMNWMWGWPETVAVVNDTFETMLALLREFPGFIFTQDQASTYAIAERYNPALFAHIQQRVREGRWEITASQWVEGDKNMASGESLSRHLLYTRRYVQEKFGLAPEDVQVDFEPDTFGHPATLPTILARGGVKYYYHCRGSHGPHLYWWSGPDGSRLLAFNDIQWYMPLAPNLVVTPVVAGPVVEFAQATGLKQMPMLYGVGDHGGGPTRADLRRIIEMDTWPVFPKFTFSTLHNFFRMAEAALEAGAARVPEISGERNRVFTGCYTSQARQKWANRRGENLLYTAEAAAVIGVRLADVPYPQANLEAAWRNLLFDQFHDILPGSGVRDTRHYTLGHAQETQAAAAMATTNALRALASHVDTNALRREFTTDTARPHKDEMESGRAGAGVGNASGTGGMSGFGAAHLSDRAFLIFNPLPHPRTEVVEVKLWDTKLDPQHLIVTGHGLEPQRVQVLDKGHYWAHDYLTVAFPVELPALGYRAVCISDRAAEFGLLHTDYGDPWAGQGGSSRADRPADVSLENEFLKVTLDPASGSLVSLLDKRTGREWIPAGEAAGVFQYCLEANNGMTAWVIGDFLEQTDLLDGGTLKRVQTGPYVNTFRWTRRIGTTGTTLELDITVRQGIPRVEFRLRVDWREIGDKESGIPHLRVRFPLNVTAAQPRYEIPFGSLVRDLNQGEEVVAQRWAGVAEADGQGVTLANTSKYGHSFDGDTLSLTLLRASIDPDPLPDLGEHIIEYALVPHGAGWTVGESTQAGEMLNLPPVIASCGFQDGDLPPALSLVAVEPANVRLAALKQAEDGDGLILRLVEVDGVATTAQITFAPELLPEGAGAIEVDMMERALAVNTARVEENAVAVKIPAFGIATVHIS
ncbi:MAG: alpha-mannosidase [Anaerolineae bacterium]